jgi:hypothetical protein
MDAPHVNRQFAAMLNLRRTMETFTKQVILHVLFAGLFVAWLAPAPANAFEMHRAINIAQWFTWPRYEAPPSQRISWPPYRNTPEPPAPSELKALREAGFDAVRLPVDYAAFKIFSHERREAVYGMLFDTVRRIHAAGLKVIIDLHPNSRHAAWGQYAVIAGFEAPAFIALGDVAEEMARRLKVFDSSRVALELINEPRLKCRGEEQRLWQRMMKRLVERARGANSDLALVVTGACLSTPEGLIALDPAALEDANLIYTFHFYEPFTFTHQGAQFVPWPDKYLDEVPWPAGARPIEEPLARLAAHMRSVTGLDLAARQKAEIGARYNLKKFYASGAGREMIEVRFEEVAQWARRHNIPSRRIFVGEFGVLRKDGDKPGARCEDRTGWLRDVRKVADKNGFSWAYFSYDGPFSIIIAENNRELDPAVLASLGLRGNTPSCP